MNKKYSVQIHIKTESYSLYVPEINSESKTNFTFFSFSPRGIYSSCRSINDTLQVYLQKTSTLVSSKPQYISVYIS